MKIYMLGTISGFHDDAFASCEESGPFATYYQQGKAVEITIEYPSWGERCPKCGLGTWIDATPCPMTWREGSEHIGDFAGLEVPCWNLLAQKRVLDFFRENDFFVKECEIFFKEVPPPSPRSRKPRYPIVPTTPYEGPPFWRIRPLYGAHFNEEKSRKTRLKNCSFCAYIEYKQYCWNRIVVDEEEWNGLKLFGVFEVWGRFTPGRGIFLSEEGHDELLKQGFSNLRCVEVGRIEKAGHGKMKPYREQAHYDFWKPDEYVPPPPKEKPKKRVKKQ